MFGKTTIKDVTNMDVAVSDKMSQEIELWMNMYQELAPWLAPPYMRSLNIPAYIAGTFAQWATSELEVTIEGSPRADYIAEQMKPVLRALQDYVEYAAAGGGLVYKPYPVIDGATVEVDYTQAPDFFPISFNSRGEITDAVFIETRIVGKTYFRRLERHSLVKRMYTVTNLAYESFDENYLGKEIPLATVDDWADLLPEIKIGGLTRPLFAYLKMPGANAIDTRSPLGVSMFSRATNLIEDADRQYTRLLWEYEGGEMAIEASRDIFPQDEHGKPIIPAGRERLFRPNEIDSNASGKGAELIKVHAPTLRDASYRSGLYDILKQIEDKCGMARGTITDPVNAAKTATEIKMMQQPSYITISKLQQNIEDALEHLIYIIDKYATLYHLAPSGKITTTYKWDDSVITDTESERMRDKDDVAAGLMQKWEYRVKWYGEDEATAKKMVGYVENEEPDEDPDPFGLDKPDPKAPKKKVAE